MLAGWFFKFFSILNKYFASSVSVNSWSQSYLSLYPSISFIFLHEMKTFSKIARQYKLYISLKSETKAVKKTAILIFSSIFPFSSLQPELRACRAHNSIFHPHTQPNQSQRYHWSQLHQSAGRLLAAPRLRVLWLVEKTARELRGLNWVSPNVQLTAMLVFNTKFRLEFLL